MKNERIHEALCILFPTADPLTAWRLEQGPHTDWEITITEWNLPDTQPTQDMLDAEYAKMEQESSLSPDIRRQMKEKINTIKNAKRDSGFIVGTTKFDSDQSARIAYAELATRFMQDPTFTTRWKASDGVWVDMTKELFDAVYTAGAEHIASAFAWQAGKEAELASLADDNLYDFYTGLSYA